MKTLFLVRHAKASHDNSSLVDRERPLNERGLHDAPEMGKRLAKRHVRPDLMVSSPARRALTTARLVASQVGYDLEDIVVEDRLYAAHVDELLAVIRKLDNKLDHVMLFGHNPEFSHLAGRLSGESIDMPTCAVAEFGFDTPSWSDVGAVEPARTALDKPKK
jgi:phosphohistidine phosphatase